MRSTRRSGQGTTDTMATAAATEYTTPARASDDAPDTTSQDAANALVATEPHHVTPPDTTKEETTTTEVPLQAIESSTGGKQVRFGVNEKEEAESPQSTSSNRGLVSKRGRYVSAGRRQVTTATTNSPPDTNPKETPPAVLEYKTYRSPPRKREESEVPSLCSTHSGTLMMEEKKKAAAVAPASSISCDPSAIQNTSPLASHESDEKKDRAMSPPPNKEDKKQAPVKSPKSGNFQTLPSLDDNKMASPGGIFLSPNPPTPSHVNIQDAGSFEEKKRDSTEEEDGKPSPRRDREYVATPTDFALDYGKGNQVSGSFDTSNVLAWLQSPTANGLFSPGGYGSMLNTPQKGGAPRTPRTPTVSTSFFFSDVASLPRGDSTPTKGGQDGNKRSQKGISNIICISPLASSRARTGSTTTTPMNLKDVFASPSEKTNVRGLPMLNDTPNKAARPRVPQRSGSKDPSLDAVHLAERDLMEDEDLSVLLQLASNTPRSAERGGAARDSAAGPVFRSPSGRKEEGGGRSDGDSGENLPALQLPMIGNGRDEGTSATRLAQKSRSRDHAADADDFAPPQLGMRSGSSSGGSKEIYVGGKAKPDTKSSKEGGGDKGDADKNASKKVTKNGPSSTPYSMHLPYPPHPGQDHPYYTMPGAHPGMPPGGSMRVVVGGPPPPRPGSKGGSPTRPGMGGSPHAPPGLFHDYPPGGLPYPPPHGVYSQYPGPYPGMGGYPYQSHYPPPPPRHMPMYGAQHPPGGPANARKPKSASKSLKAGGKRNSPLLDPKTAGGAVKKQKKTPSSQSKKKKKTSTEISSAERQKAAAAIQSVNAASGGKNDKAAALAAAILRGVTMRPSGKWQAQLYFAGKSRYIGVFDTREKAALAYEIAREKLKSGSQETGGSNPKTTENLVNAARKAAFEGVNERSKA